MPTFHGSDAVIHLREHELEIEPLPSAGQNPIAPHEIALPEIAHVEDRSPSILREGYVRVLSRDDLGQGVKDARTVHFGRDAKTEFAGLIQHLKDVATRNVAERPLDESGGAPTSIDAAMAKNEAALAQRREQHQRRDEEAQAKRERRRAERRR